jgi:hypothetical protein
MLHCLFGLKLLALCFVGSMLYGVEVSLEAEGMLLLGLGDVCEAFVMSSPKNEDDLQ